MSIQNAIEKNLAIIEAALDPRLVEQARSDLERLGYTGGVPEATETEEGKENE